MKYEEGLISERVKSTYIFVKILKSAQTIFESNTNRHGTASYPLE
jgi:hypothetical protein